MKRFIKIDNCMSKTQCIWLDGTSNLKEGIGVGWYLSGRKNSSGEILD